MAQPTRVRQRPARPLWRSATDAFVFVVALSVIAVALKVSGVLTIDDGPVRILDGDSLRRGEIDIRLAGIDAPEYDQICRDETGRNWACGRAAAQELRKLVDGRDVGCSAVETDRYGRTVAHCTAGDIDLNKEMVRLGFAVSYDGFAYARSEAEARDAKRGLWRGKFENPRAWRERHRFVGGDGEPGSPQN